MVGNICLVLVATVVISNGPWNELSEQVVGRQVLQESCLLLAQRTLQRRAQNSSVE